MTGLSRPGGRRTPVRRPTPLRLGAHARAWSRLDNTAIIFPPIISRRFTTTFRVTLRFTGAIDVDALGRALAWAWRRMPYLCMRLRHGVFWYFLEEARPAGVRPDGPHVCSMPPGRASDTPLVQVFARARAFSTEASHAITDGMGLLAFTRALAVAYHLERRAIAADGDSAAARAIWADARERGILAPGDRDPGEEEFAGRREYLRHLPDPDGVTGAWHLPGALLPPGRYRVTTLRYAAGTAREQAASLGVSVTDFLVACVFLALQREYHRGPEPPRRRRKPIRIMVPVNVRPLFESRTMRNFFVTILIEIDQRVGRYRIEEAAHIVHHKVRAQLDARTLRRQFRRNVSAERNPVLRLLPTVLKRPILRLAHRLFGDNTNTVSVSNLGRIDLPPDVMRDIAAAELVPLPSAVTKLNVGVATAGSTLSVTVGSMRRGMAFERDLARVFAEHGFTGTVETNEPEVSSAVL